MTTMTSTSQPARSPLGDLVADMIAERKQFAFDHGFVATDAEIADSIKASLIRMARKD